MAERRAVLLTTLRKELRIVGPRDSGISHAGVDQILGPKLCICMDEHRSAVWP